MSGPFARPAFGHDPFGAEHDRARRLAAERLATSLDDDDSRWLATHLAWCAPCRAVRDEYEAQRIELRSLRLDEPTPPRMLWARTSAALDRERPVRPVATLGSGGTVVRGRNPVPLGAMSGMLVIALVVGASMLGGAPLLRPGTTAAPRQPGPRPDATPFPVPVREVALYTQLADGRLAFVTGRVNQVCPLDVGAGCAVARFGDRRLLEVGTARAQVVLESPTRSQFVVVGRDPDGSGVDVYVVPVERGAPTAPAPSIPPEATVAPVASPSGEPEPAGSPAPSDAGAAPTEPRTGAAAASPDPVGAGDPVASADGSREPGDADDGASPKPSGPDDGAPDAGAPDPGTTPTPGATPAPGLDTIVRIASDVLVVGDVGAYAPDGSAFAFTARPADGRHGPDVYLWRAGEPEATAVTTDHASVFADWAGGLLLVSRVSGDVAADGSQQPVSMLVDPATGVQRVLAMPAAWRPTVDPASRTAVWWDGSVRRSVSGSGWHGANGKLVLGDWRGPDATRVPGDSPAAPDVLAEGPVGEWQARWDETGSRLAVWIASESDPAVGRLSLYRIDPRSGRIDREAVILRDEPALAGFSIGGGRLAWVRPGVDAASTVVVVAWTERDVGKVDLVPESESLIVIR